MSASSIDRVFFDIRPEFLAKFLSGAYAPPLTSMETQLLTKTRVFNAINDALTEERFSYRGNLYQLIILDLHNRSLASPRDAVLFLLDAYDNDYTMDALEALVAAANGGMSLSAEALYEMSGQFSNGLPATWLVNLVGQASETNGENDSSDLNGAWSQTGASPAGSGAATKFNASSLNMDALNAFK